MKNIPEGTLFAVPLRNGKFARGIVGRSSANSGIIWGYFFGPALEVVTTTSFLGLTANRAVLAIRLGDLALQKGMWKTYGKMPDWNREAWSMPDFARRDPLSTRVTRVRYADDDPNIVELESSENPACKLSTDAVSGYGSVEIKLAKLLNQ